MCVCVCVCVAKSLSFAFFSFPCFPFFFFPTMMDVVALVSGGKDSCHNMLHCIAAGHRIVAIANMAPPQDTGVSCTPTSNSLRFLLFRSPSFPSPHRGASLFPDEMDSYMYQTVGHEAISLLAEAMQLPLYRGIVQGASVDTSKVCWPPKSLCHHSLSRVCAHICIHPPAPFAHLSRRMLRRKAMKWRTSHSCCSWSKRTTLL